MVLVVFPNSDLRTAKLRPALIVQADGLNTGLSQIVVAMISSRTSRANHPSRVLITPAQPEGQKSGLLVDSIVMTDNIATITHVAVSRVIGRIDNMRKVDTALRHTLGL